MSTLEAPTYVPHAAAGGGRRPRRILLGMMVAVFFSGGVIGSGSTLMVVNRRIKESEQPRPVPDWCRKIVAELEEKLSLSEEQTAQVDQIMKDHLAALDRLRREVFFKAIREQFKQMEDQVNAVLDDQQSVQWHAWLEERRKRVCPTNGRTQKPGSAKQTKTPRTSEAKADGAGDRSQ
ncbi:MAG TPA: hypothetical protein VG826_09445 [Pirellulales bacterium]|nr:hypothetical protein [Pirellulales bacterium]